jgi:hypothetical protein
MLPTAKWASYPCAYLCAIRERTSTTAALSHRSVASGPKNRAAWTTSIVYTTRSLLIGISQAVSAHVSLQYYSGRTPRPVMPGNERGLPRQESPKPCKVLCH